MLIGCCGPVEKYQQIANDGYDYFEALGWQIFDLGLADFMDFVDLTERTGLSEDQIRELIQISLDAAALGDIADQEQPQQQENERHRRTT